MTQKKLLIISILAGLGALVAAQVFLTQAENRIRGEERRVKVITAARDVEPNKRFQKADFKEEEVPSWYLDRDPDLVPWSDVGMLTAGGVSQRAIREGAHIRLADVLSRKDVSHMISDGKVAVGIPVNMVSSLAYMIRPGHTVSVLVTHRGQNALSGNTGPVVDQVLTRVRVVGVGNQLSEIALPSRRDRSYSSITVEVSPSEATELSRVLESSGGASGVSILLHPSSP